RRNHLAASTLHCVSLFNCLIAPVIFLSAVLWRMARASCLLQETLHFCAPAYQNCAAKPLSCDTAENIHTSIRLRLRRLTVVAGNIFPHVCSVNGCSTTATMQGGFHM
uniref:Uncharacterized protein n=1 Tax=Scophthalmus maximus TaxID=52904 RepID=A0A8D3CP36_SCOMX